MKFQTIKDTAAQDFVTEFEADSIFEAMEIAPTVARYGFRKSARAQSCLILRIKTEKGWKEIGTLGAVYQDKQGYFYKDFSNWRNSLSGKRIPMNEAKIMEMVNR